MKNLIPLHKHFGMHKVEKVLFIDDDPVCSYINKILVEDLGIAKEVVVLHKASDALEYMQQHYASGDGKFRQACPDLIFLDLHMPGLDGFEFLTELETMEGIDSSRFTIVMLTGSLHPQDKERAACFGNILGAYLAKPIAKEDLDKLLEALELQS